jgi:general secretion pathway protein M
MNMKQYWANLQPRERHTLLGGGIVLALVLIYALVVDPFQQALAGLQQSVASQEETLAWMRQASAEIKRLRAAAPGARSVSGQSLMSLIDASARSTGLSGAIKQIRPEGQGVKVRLEEVAFDDMLRWLDQLQRNHGVGLGSLVMERLAQPGRVNASVTLEGGSR